MVSSAKPTGGAASEAILAGPSMGQLPSLLRGAGSVLAIRAAGAGLALVAQILLARWMGAAEYGVFLFAWTCALMLSLPASLGLSQASLRFIPEYLALGRWDYLAGAMARFRVLVGGGGAVLAAIGVVSVTLFATYIPPAYATPLVVAMACIPLFALQKLQSEFARGFGRMSLAYAPDLLLRPALLLFLVGTWAFWGKQAQAPVALAFVAIAALMALIFQVVLFERGRPRPSRKVPRAYQTWHWVRVAMPLLASEGLIVVLGETDVLMLGALRSSRDVATYGAALKIGSLAFFVYFATSALAVPRLAALHARRSHAELEDFLQLIIRWTLWPSLLVTVGLLTLGRPLLALFGPEFPSGYIVLVAIAAQSLVLSITGPAPALLQVSGHQKASLVAFASGAVLNLLLNAALIPPYGPAGAALATFFSACLTRLLAVTFVRRRLNVLALYAPLGSRGGAGARSVS